MRIVAFGQVWAARLFGAAVCGVIFAGTASADEVTAPVEAPSGTVRIVDASDGFSRYIGVAGARFFDTGDYRYVDLIDRRGKLIFVRLSTGGSGYGGEFIWLHTGAGEVRVTEVFGTCDDVADVRSDAETVTVRLRGTASEGFVDFIYDGRVIREVTAGQATSTRGPGAGAAPWIGRYPFDLMRAADWQAEFVALMGEANYRRAGVTISVSSPMVQDGDWVVGRGCRRPCDAYYGAVAINLNDGGLLVALREPDAGAQMWGRADGPLPGAIAAVMEGRP